MAAKNRSEAQIATSALAECPKGERSEAMSALLFSQSQSLHVSLSMFDPTYPPTNALIESAPLRDQFNSLKALIDADPQSSASQWIKELALPIQLEQIDSPEEIIHRLAKLAGDANDIVIDGPAGLSATTRAIMLRADRVFFPCGPSILDLRAASKAVQLLREAQKTRKGKPEGLLIPNKLQKRGRLSREMMNAAKKLGVDVTAGVCLRQSFADSAGQAKVVWQMGAGALLASLEMQQLMKDMTRG